VEFDFVPISLNHFERVFFADLIRKITLTKQKLLTFTTYCLALLIHNMAQTKAQRSVAARKAARTRKRNARERSERSRKAASRRRTARRTSRRRTARRTSKRRTARRRTAI